MDEARAVLARLERIEALEREGAAVPSLLAELRELVREAGAWAERERDPRARRAAEALVEAQQRAADDRSSERSHRSYESLVPSAAAARPIE
jgi:ElaB/YqjD/DUF883 family membrane-anchored ribosome-binding protein